MSKPRTFDAILSDVKVLAQSVSSSMVKKITAEEIGLRSKLPFKVLALRELLHQRAVALANPAAQLLEQGHFVAGAAVTRALVETVAVAYALSVRLGKAIHRKDTKDLDGFLMRGLLASGAPDAKHPAMNITGFVIALDKKSKGFRTAYHMLSEATHPNWAGLMGAFGTADRENRAVQLGPTDRGELKRNAAIALHVALLMFVETYNSLGEQLRQFHAQIAEVET